MTTITFDTHAAVKRLKEAGYSETQAEAVTALVKEGQDAAVVDFATKTDIQLLEQRLTIKMGAMMIALGGFLTVIKFFGH